MTGKSLTKKQHKKTIYETFEFISEVYGWIRIMISPLLIGIFAGAIIFLRKPSVFTLVLGILVSLTGLISGVLFANKMWKGKGTIWLLSRVIATPELDHEEEN